MIQYVDPLLPQYVQKHLVVMNTFKVFICAIVFLLIVNTLYRIVKFAHRRHHANK